MMPSPCPLMGHVVWRVFLSARTVLPSLAREENHGSWDNNQGTGPEKGPFSPGAPGARVCPCQTRVAWAGGRDLAVCGWRGA